MILYTILFYFFNTFYIFTILCLITFFCLYKNIGRYDIKVVTGSANLCFQKINSILIFYYENSITNIWICDIKDICT